MVPSPSATLYQVQFLTIPGNKAHTWTKSIVYIDGEIIPEIEAHPIPQKIIDNTTPNKYRLVSGPTQKSSSSSFKV